MKRNRQLTFTRPMLRLATTQLRNLCAQAEALKFSNGPNEQFWDQVDPSGVHVVSVWFVHRPNIAMWRGVDHPWDFNRGGGKNIRALLLCQMHCKSKPADLLCDFDFDAFMALVENARKLTNAG